MRLTALCILVTFTCLVPASAAGAETCGIGEARRTRLFASLDLQRGELAEVRHAVAAEDWVAACRALVEHCRRQPADWPGGRRRGQAVAQADRLLEGRITILNVDGRLARRADGGVEWLDRGPRDDREWTSYLNRHLHLRTLLHAYLETERESYLRELAGQLRDWILKNPYDGERSVSPDMRWYSLEPANRILVWREVFDALRSSPRTDDATLLLLLLSSLHDHAHFLRHHHSPPGNHLLREMEGLATVAARWPEFADAGDWLGYSQQQVGLWLANQLYPDGVDRELSAFYHRIVLQRLSSYREILRHVGVELPPDSLVAVELAYDYLVRTLRPSGTMPLNNDGDLVDSRQMLRQAAARYDRPDWLHVLSHGREGGPPPAPASKLFPWAGQLVMRSGWDEDARWAFFDVGPAGKGSHQHADRLHLSVAAFGRDLLVDAGRYTYDKAVPWREYFRGSPSHNLILVDGRGQHLARHVVKTPLDAGHVSLRPGLVLGRGTYDHGFAGVEGQAEHHRAVAFVEGELWIVVDRIVTDRPRALRTLWHFHPDCGVEVDGTDVVSTDAGLGNLRIASLAGPAWQVELIRGREEPEIQGWWSEAYGRKRPATAAVFSARVERTQTFVWLLRPARGEVPRGGAEVLAASEEGVSVRVETTAGRRVVDVPLTDPPSPGGESARP